MIPCGRTTSRVEENRVMDTPEAHCVAVTARSFPHDLASVVIRPEDAVHQQLQVVAGRRVTMYIDTPRRLQDAAKFDKARNHHHKVSHHRAGFEERVECGRQRHDILGNWVSGDSPVNDTVVRGVSFCTPRPRVLKRLDLSCLLRRLFSCRFE